MNSSQENYLNKLKQIETDVNTSQRLISDQLSSIQKFQAKVTHNKAFYQIFDFFLVAILIICVISFVIAKDTNFMQKIWDVLD